MKKIVVLLIALMVISVGFLSGCSENGESNAYDYTREKETKWEDSYTLYDTYFSY